MNAQRAVNGHLGTDRVERMAAASTMGVNGETGKAEPRADIAKAMRV